MTTPRYGFSLTLLPDGEVLAVEAAVEPTRAALYDPAKGTWKMTGSTTTSNVGGPNAAFLPDGEGLAVGESINTPSELYNPGTGTWSTTVSEGTTIINPITPRLPGGEVFFTGSFASASASYSTDALYDPATGQFTQDNGPCSCKGFNGALFQTGMVLVAGGFITVHARPYNKTETINSAELWDPSTQAWTSTRNLNISRGSESMTILTNGQALVAGGDTFDQQSGQLVVTATAELYKP